MKALSLATLISNCGPVIAVQVTSYQVGGQKAAETRLRDPFVSLDGSQEFWTSCDTCPACVPLCDFLGRRGQGFCHILKDFAAACDEVPFGGYRGPGAAVGGRADSWTRR